MGIPTKFKPNLIPNAPKDGSFDRTEFEATIAKNGGIEEYTVLPKKDGCRMEFGLGPKVLTRSLKEPGSDLVKARFDELNKICLKENIILEGEFYMHGLPFNEIFRFFSKSDVTTQDYIDELTKMKENKPEAFQEKYRGRDIEFLTTFHENLKCYAFDFIITDRPDLIGFKERWGEAHRRLWAYELEEEYLVMPTAIQIESIEKLEAAYNYALTFGWEGLVLTHNTHPYKFGRSTLNQGTLLKMKDDKNEYDGVILDVEEATMVKDGVEKTVNELGRSKTSQLKADRIPSGMAKGFVVEFEGKGTFSVGLNGFDHDARRELLDNKQNYIGRYFKYTGMPPIKDFPRHAFFDSWRDEK